MLQTKTIKVPAFGFWPRKTLRILNRLLKFTRKVLSSTKSDTMENTACRSFSYVSKNWLRIAQQAFGSAKVQIVHPGRRKMKIPEGYTYEAFNSKAQPTVWSTLRHFEATRVMNFWKVPSQGEYQFLDIGSLPRMVYIVSTKLSCEPDLYNPDIEKSPVKTDNQLVYVGNTSFKIRSDLLITEDLQKVAQQDICTVLVDKETRRPSAPPAWWGEKYARYSLPDEGPIKAEYFDFRSWTGKVHEEKFVVRSADVDPYFHLNNLVFSRFCYEAYVSYYLREFGNSDPGSAVRNVKDLVCTYKGEAALGEELNVALVIDPNFDEICHFEITKGSTLIFQCQITFFPQVM